MNTIKAIKSNQQFGPSLQMTNFEIKQSTAAFTTQTLIPAACPMFGLDIKDIAKLIKLLGQHVISMCATITRSTKLGALELSIGMVSDLLANHQNNHQKHPEPCPE